MKKIITACSLALAVNSGAAWAECTRPDSQPAVADGAKASKEVMIASNQAVKAYVADTNAYLACLEEEEKAAMEADTDTDETRAARMTAYNSAVDDMSALAQKLNEEIREFTAKNK